MSKQEDIANVLIADNDPELARFMLEILARKESADISSATRKKHLTLSARAVAILYLPVT